jgi:hypothetical protein
MCPCGRSTPKEQHPRKDGGAVGWWGTKRAEGPSGENEHGATCQQLEEIEAPIEFDRGLMDFRNTKE